MVGGHVRLHWVCRRIVDEGLIKTNKLLCAGYLVVGIRLARGTGPLINTGRYARSTGPLINSPCQWRWGGWSAQEKSCS